ncbi:saccharopine dehydrogenase NADP-binding domain-containing protein [Temperatibacter marinus]|uniref:Saccharopine dehydrogenase NADP-binding domain-containing protein n=1 Tax=Temperatibacter marinus TaxID=1456591 RepID=A0AA52HAR0_9PROT|nr:saccharopine dehydrogenase NADP-binding domain-containing protein [Temperatibacter marinus]WND03005.1 saccharopine dehydrogenase NADP-binding domain-containing protein [Temperatibacter marinus]
MEKFDIIIYGATSFVGDIIVAYMMDKYGTDRGISWAIAGRSEAKLLDLREKHKAQDIPYFIADAGDEESLKALVDQTKVILSTVGPYALYGEPLVKICTETGTDYCDLTGEIQWYKKMLDHYEEAAKKSGARIVHCSGFDSIPSDMGVFYLQEHAKQKTGSYLTQVDMRVAKIKGGASGGTIASMVNLTKEAVKDPKVRKLVKNPYSICPEGHGFTVRQHNVSKAEFDEQYHAWIAPFVMEAVNSRVVHRSNALRDKAYGRDFKYSEAMVMGRDSNGKSRARKMSLGLTIFMTLAALAPTRWILEKFILPKPGEGPSPKEQETGMYDLRFVGRSDQGDKLTLKLTGDKDPGYGSTSKMISETAVCLAALDKLEKKGGFWTPSTLFGHTLIERLEQNAGLTFEILNE